MNEMSPITAHPTQPGPARFSVAEFGRMINAGAFEDIWVELIEGELERMPPPGREHSRLQMTVVAGLLRHFPQSRLFGDIAVGLGDDTVVASDAILLRGEGGSGTVVDAAEVLLAVEVAVSTRDRDLGLKRRLYAAAGIPTYWVIDAEHRATRVFDRPDAGDYRGTAPVPFGEALAVPGTECGTMVLE